MCRSCVLGTTTRNLLEDTLVQLSNFSSSAYTVPGKAVPLRVLAADVSVFGIGNSMVRRFM